MRQRFQGIHVCMKIMKLHVLLHRSTARVERDYNWLKVGSSDIPRNAEVRGVGQ